MGQKTNPTALRLEKTNQHSKFIGYSDRFYPEQLHHNYKTEDYITKVFYKVKKIGVNFYSKIGYKVNQVFCVFPKTRFRRFYRRRPVIGEDVKPNKDIFLCLLYNSRQNKLKPENTLKQIGVCPETTCGNFSRATAQTMGKPFSKEWSRRPESLTTLLVAAFQRQILDQDLERSVPTSGKDKAQSKFPTPKSKGYAVRATPDLKSHVSRLSQAMVAKPPILTELKSARGFLPPEQLGSFCRDYSRCYVQKKSGQNKHYSNYLWNCNHREVYLMKTSFPQQSCQFLAQFIFNVLKNRWTFQRLRKHIMRDVRFSPYIKGVRVTLSGRVESRSKKAQRARARTFQWGQTELHVFSSLVQFTSQPCVTPFGKIGIKVWVCYGTLT